MKTVKVNDRLSIGSQPNLSDFNVLRDFGFLSVISNRPDGEEPGQLTAEGASLEAEAAGLGYGFQPVTLNAITEGDVRKFQQHVAKLEGPVFAHCRSGTRSLTLWILGEVLDGRMAPSEIIPFGRQFGVDLNVAAQWAANHANANGEKL